MLESLLLAVLLFLALPFIVFITALWFVVVYRFIDWVCTWIWFRL
jgi:hypothetical protein